ncbi:hypothetical protein KUCAC02_033663 [Chaenocephalus aceratus]|nr:hypothetical protein KUCAC02_033663 [Chaenocephalus aceratus]
MLRISEKAQLVSSRTAGVITHSWCHHAQLVSSRTPRAFSGTASHFKNTRTPGLETRCEELQEELAEKESEVCTRLCIDGSLKVTCTPVVKLMDHFMK